MRWRFSPDERGFDIQNVGDRRRDLGVDDQHPVGPFQLGRSTLPDVLQDRVVEVPVAFEPRARVLYFDFEFGALLGLVPEAAHFLSEELQERLLRILSYRIVDETASSDVVAHADRYGGVGLAESKGAGRAVILPWCNLVVHGVGVTPLASNRPDDHPLHRGRAPMIQAWSRLVRSQVFDQTFAVQGSRILAVLDWGETAVAPAGLASIPEGATERQGVFVRAGRQLRPGHLLAGKFEGGAFSAELFDRMMDAYGVPGRDSTEAMSRFVERHARLQAQAMRYRMLHGVLSTSNMQIDGGMLDVEASSTQPGTAPIMSMDFQSKFGFVPVMDQFGFEQFARTNELQVAYDAVRTADPQRPEFRVEAPLLRQYEAQLTEELVVALGLMRPLARHLIESQPAEADRLRQLFVQLTRLIAPGNRNLLPVPSRISVVRVFEAWSELAACHYGEGLTPDRVFERLRFETFDAVPPHRTRLVLRARSLADALSSCVRTLLDAAPHSPWYDDRATMQQSVVARARFSNQRLATMERDQLEALMRDAVETLVFLDAGESIQRLANECIVSALRSVDRLLRQGKHAVIDGELHTQIRRCVYTQCSLRVDTAGQSKLRIEWLGEGDLLQVDGWASAASSFVPLKGEAPGLFEIPVPLLAGRIAGRVTSTTGEIGVLGPYAFVAPERRERQEIMEALRRAELSS